MIKTCSNNWSTLRPMIKFTFPFHTHILDHILRPLFIIADKTARFLLIIYRFNPSIICIIFKLLKSHSASFLLFILEYLCFMFSIITFDYISTHYTLQSASSFVYLILKGRQLLLEHRFFLLIYHVYFALLFLS